MTNYEQLKKKICEALPRLMEIKEYQICKKDGSTSIILQCLDEGYWLHNALCGEIEFVYKSEFKEFEVLGIDPTLSDVLEFMMPFTDESIEMTSFALWIGHGGEWNLSQPLLKDQSEELIDYLLGL